MESFGGGSATGHVAEICPLAQLRPGDRATVVRLEGGSGFRSRVVAMGIVPGREIEVLTGRRRHPFLVRIGSTRIMIGWGMLDRIVVRPTGGGSTGEE
ncbi:FeoA family protein [Salinispira pacifica]